MKVHIDLHVTEYVACNGNVTAPQFTLCIGRSGPALADNADVCRLGRVVGMLNRTAGYGDFSDRAARSIYQHICCRRHLFTHISFNIAVADLQIPDVSAALYNPSAGIITYV
ncbi:hypothetical protein ES703_75908 [subsurface metagenome]